MHKDLRKEGIGKGHILSGFLTLSNCASESSRYAKLGDTSISEVTPANTLLNTRPTLAPLGGHVPPLPNIPIPSPNPGWPPLRTSSSSKSSKRASERRVVKMPFPKRK